MLPRGIRAYPRITPPRQPDVSLDTVVSRLPNGTVATLPLPIPYSTQLIAQQFFVQGATLDSGANALGITVSNAPAATIGWLCQSGRQQRAADQRRRRQPVEQR